ncbi:MAG TPA: extracellular solute-binding protein [Kineosporiaceae bacterium]|nr:extracellular solute-binding protein [Kineosporiaceae bacterium]
MGVFSRHDRLAAAALASVLVLGVAACGGDDTGDSADGATDKVELTLDIFGDFGYEDLLDQYQKDNPNVTVKVRGSGATLDDYGAQLTKYLATRKGAGDVVALEEGQLIQYKANPQHFEDLKKYGSEADKADFLPWKYDLGVAKDGKQIGVGTDVGGLAMCYRKDLFKAAGLPSAPEAVSKLWPTWDAYIETGKKYASKTKKKKFTDSATANFNVILMQEAEKTTGYTYFDTSDQLAVESNPAVKGAFDTAAAMKEAGITANLGQWGNDWSQGFKQGTFATIACPSWMLGIIEKNSGPGNSGKWGVAKVPGDSGNWGGSHLAVPSQGKHKEAAAALALFLTSKEGQIGAFKKVGALPSRLSALDDATVKDARNTYFSDAPTGQLFGAGVTSMKPVYLGPKNQAVRTAVETAVTQVDNGKLDENSGWTTAVKNAKTNAAK